MDNVPLEEVMERYDQIITMIENRPSNVIIYMMAYYPISCEAAIEVFFIPR